MGSKEEIKKNSDEIKANGYKKICFWLPAYNVGGGTYYFCELAKYLKENTDLEVYYMDYKDGYPSSLLKNSNVGILEYKERDKAFPLQEKCVIVTNSTRVIQLKKMNAENKLLFWHYETVPCDWNALFILNEAKEFLQLCREKKAIVYHDWSSRNILHRQFDLNFDNKDYLYMYLPPKEAKQSKGILIDDNEINLVWLGRVATEKIYSIYNLIENYAIYPTNKKKKLHVVGEGWKLNDLKNFIKGYEKEIEFNFTGTIKKKDLDDFLINNADILFAMGLSAVEGAALNIPSVVVQLDTKPIFDDDFYWIFDTKEYCMGILPEQKEAFEVKYSKFKDILDDIYIKNKKAVLAKQSYQYYLKNLSAYDMLVNNFLSYVNESILTMKELQDCIKYIPYNHVKLVKYKFINKLIYKKIVFK